MLSEAAQRLEQAVTRSQRRASVNFPIAFVRSVDGSPPPLARIMRGGQGGESRLRVYLLVRLLATAPPHAVTVSARELARYLGMDVDGTDMGPRRVNASLRALGRSNATPQGADAIPRLLSFSDTPGLTRSIQVLDPAGSGEAWNDRQIQPPYVTVPLSLWRRGWLLELSGRATAMLLILRELTGGRGDDRGWADGIRKRQYGLSDDTWTRATKELVDRGLLTVDSDILISQGEPRRRNRYQLHLDSLEYMHPYEDPLDPLHERRWRPAE